MGVKDLWQLLAPIGRRVSVETLEGKTLAIDASIWITQFIKAMRDEEGKMMKNAHLIGTLRRVLKLLFHRIKPLFVFDGATPTLKLRVVQARRKNQDKQEENKRVAALRLLRAQLKQYASEQTKIPATSSSVDDDNGKFVSSFKLGKGQAIPTATDGEVQTAVGKSSAPVKSGVGVPGLSGGAAARTNDDHDQDDVQWVDGYESLRSKPLGGGARGSSSGSHGGHDDDGELEWQLPENTGDLSPEVLAALPAHIRKSLIEEARRRQRMESRAHYLPVAGNPALYSQTQLSNFLSSSKLNRKFADAQVTIEGSAGLGSKIAAEGSKMYKFTSRITSAAAPPPGGADAGAAGGASGAGGLRKADAISTVIGIDIGSDGMDADGDVEGDEGYWEPAGIEDRGGGSEVGDGNGNCVEGTRAVRESSLTMIDTLICESGEAVPVSNALGGFLSDEEDQGQVSRAEVSSARNAVVMEDVPLKPAEVFQLYDSDSDNAGNSDNQSEEVAEVEEEDDEEVAWESESAASTTEDEGQGQGLEQDSHSGSDSFGGDAGVDVGAGSLSSPIAAQPVAAGGWPLVKASESGDANNDNFPSSSGRNGFSNVSDALDQTALDRAVLDRAVLTASSMADWAGRAVRNALKELHKSSAGSSGNIASVASSSVVAQPVTARSPEPQPSTGNRNSSGDVEQGQGQDTGHVTGASISVSSAAAIGSPAEAATVLAEANSPVSLPVSMSVPYSPGFEDYSEEERVASSAQEAQQDARDTRDARRRFNNAMRDTESLTDEMREEVILLLQALNLPYLIAPYEAEAQCAVLEQLGLVDGVVTEDSDALLFGAKTVYKNIFSDKKFVEVYLAEDARLEMGLHREDLVALAYFLGSDYAEGVTGVGIVNAVEIVHAFSMHNGSSNNQKAASSSSAPAQTAAGGATEAPLEGLRKFKDWLHGFDLQSELLYNSTASTSSDKQGGSSGAEQHAGIDAKLVQFTQKHRSGRSRWSVPDNFPDPLVARAYLHPQAQYSTDPFIWAVPLRGPIRRFCSDRLGWTDAQMDLAIDPVLKRFAERNTQTRIDAHYLTYHGDTRFAKIASDRLREAVVQITGKRSSALALGVGSHSEAGGEGSTSSKGGKGGKKKRKKGAADDST